MNQPDELPLHDVEKQPLHAQPFDRFATVITDRPNDPANGSFAVSVSGEDKFLGNYNKNKNSSNFLGQHRTVLLAQPSDSQAIT